jgi:hypothetical protein
MTKLGRPSVWAQHREAWVKLFEEGSSRGQIARQYGTSVQTVTRQLSEAGADLTLDRVGDAPAPRTPERQAEINAKISANRKGKGIGPRVVHDDRICQNPACGKSYQYAPGRSGEKFCSRACRNVVRATSNQLSAREEYDSEPRRCPCGEAIPYEYRHTRLYCSPEHRTQYQAKRAEDPTRHVTITCQNEKCGKEIKRYKGYGNGALKFCSNACAQKHTKTRRFYAVEDFDIVFESSWETLFWGLCAFLKVPIERYDRGNGVAWSESGWYAPDFWLPFPGVAIEVKGQEGPEDEAKWQAFREQREQRLIVVDRPLLDRLRVAANAHDFEALLS